MNCWPFKEEHGIAYAACQETHAKACSRHNRKVPESRSLKYGPCVLAVVAMPNHVEGDYFVTGQRIETQDCCRGNQIRSAQFSGRLCARMSGMEARRYHGLEADQLGGRANNMGNKGAQ